MIKTYWRQGAEIIAAVLIGKAFAALWKLLLARIGPTQFGVISIALTAFYTFSSFGLLGFHTALMRFVAIAKNARRTEAAHALLRLSVKLTLAVSLLLMAAVTAFPDMLPFVLSASARAIGPVRAYLWIAPVLALSELLWSYMAATGNMRRYALSKYVSTPVLRLSFLAVLILLGKTTVPYLLLHLGVSSLLAFVLAVGLIIRYRDKAAWNTPSDSRFLPYAIAMSGSFLAFTLYGALDVLFAARFLGPQAVGLLAALGMLTQDALDILYGPLLNVIPAHMGSMRRDIRAGFSFIGANIGMFLMTGTVLAIAIFSVRRPVVTYLLGPSYETIVPLVGLFLLTRVADNAIVLPLRHFLDFYGHVRLTLILMLISLAAKGVTGAVMIPRLGLYGIWLAQAMGIGVHIVAAGFMTAWVLRRNTEK